MFAQMSDAIETSRLNQEGQCRKSGTCEGRLSVLERLFFNKLLSEIGLAWPQVWRSYREGCAGCVRLWQSDGS